MNKNYLEILGQIKNNFEQTEALNYKNSILIKAGPGSGKTTVLAMKAYQLNNQIDSPKKIACLTYSNEAVNSLKKKLNKIGLVEKNSIFIGTLHSFCLKHILYPFQDVFQKHGIPKDFKIISKNNKEKIIEIIKQELGLGQIFLSITDIDKERKLSLKGLSEVGIPTYDIARQVAVAYEKYLMDNYLMDFESIINTSLKIVQEEEYIRNYISCKFPWILIDEYQDLGKPLHEMVLCFFKNTKIKFFIVGDPDQSIYGFQGAIPDFFHELENKDTLKKISFKQNYRSSQNIIEGFENILSDKCRYRSTEKDTADSSFFFLRTSEDLKSQISCLSNYLLKEISINTPLDEIAIMVNSNAKTKILKTSLEENNYPCYISKHNFKKSEVIEWIIKCAKWSIDNSSSSFSEIFQFYRNLKSKQINDEVNSFENKKKLYLTLKGLMIYNSNSTYWINNFIEKTQIIEILETQNFDEIDNIIVFKKEISTETQTLSDFETLFEKDGKISIITRHSSKGLEFSIVILLEMEEGKFPFYRNTTIEKLNEDKRLFFVTVSRAKDKCYFLFSKYCNGYSKNPSVFIRNLATFLSDKKIDYIFEDVSENF